MGSLITAFNQTQGINQLTASPTFSSGGAASANKAEAAGVGMIASGVISGLSDIANSFINASRVKSTYKFNARMAELEGRMIRLSADIQIKNIRKKAQSLFSAQIAGYAKAGVKLEGSPAEVMKNSLKESELDAIYADISATYNVGLSRTQGDIYKAQGQSAVMDAYTKSFATILNTGTKAYTEYSVNK
ncbi:MAG: hypothetical protein PHW73_09435 [Atribacterota bacterium]|nr:hypothetical protein [Atribacterota bacterium]